MRIIYNGSKWAGEEPDSLEKLLEVLERHTLDPRMDHIRVLASDGDTGMPFIRVGGNFIEVSHCFRVEGNPSEMRPLVRAMKANRRRPAYRELKESIRRAEKARLAGFSRRAKPVRAGVEAR